MTLTKAQHAEITNVPTKEEMDIIEVISKMPFNEQWFTLKTAYGEIDVIPKDDGQVYIYAGGCRYGSGDYAYLTYRDQEWIVGGDVCPMAKLSEGFREWTWAEFYGDKEHNGQPLKVEGKGIRGRDCPPTYRAKIVGEVLRVLGEWWRDPKNTNAIGLSIAAQLYQNAESQGKKCDDAEKKLATEREEYAKREAKMLHMVRQVLGAKS